MGRELREASVWEVLKAHLGFALAVIAGLLVWWLFKEELLTRSEALLLFGTAGFTIVAGYVFAAVAVGPRFRGTDLRTKVGGFWFFTLCAITHLHLSIHALASEPVALADMLDWHMVAHMSAQAWAIWEFLLGLGRYFKAQEEELARTPRRRASDQPGPRI